MSLEALLFSLGGRVAGKLIARRFGPELSDLATEVLDTLGAAFGVTDTNDEEAIAQAIEDLPEPEARRKIEAVELKSADMVLARVKLQQAENQGLLLLNQQIAAEQKGHWFGWAWRPAWMWGLLFLWIWSIVILHMINAIMKWALPPTDLVQLAAVSLAFSGLYMGGHTIKDWVAKKWGSES